MRVIVEFCDWCCQEGGVTKRRLYSPSIGVSRWEMGLCESCLNALDSQRFDTFAMRHLLNVGVTAVDRNPG